MKYRFDLTPDDLKIRSAVDMGTMFLAIVLALYIAGLIGIGILYEKRFIDLQDSLTQLNFHKNQLLFDEQAAGQILNRITRIQDREIKDRKVLALINDLVNNRIQWTRTLAQLSHVVPDGAWLQSMSSTGEGPTRRIVFRGMALSNQWVARFLFFLENHPDFYDVQLEYSRLSKIAAREVYSFEIRSRMTQNRGRTSDGS